MYVGIDPGKTGAIAVQYDDESIEVFDVPTFERPAGKSTKNRKTFHEVDATELCSIFARISERARDGAFVVIERMSARPTDTPHNAMDLGITAGLIEGVAAGYDLPVTHKPLPLQWKRKLGLLGEDKEASRQLAINLFPIAARYLRRKKDHNRAEALLLIEWTKRTEAQQ